MLIPHQACLELEAQVIILDLYLCILWVPFEFLALNLMINAL